MPRRRTDPDPALVLGVLDPDEQRVVAGWVESLGLDSWADCPPLRTLLPLLAALRLAGDMDLPLGDALAGACEALGMEDDPDYPTRPSDSMARTLRRWCGGTGQVARPACEDVA